MFKTKADLRTECPSPGLWRNAGFGCPCGCSLKVVCTDQKEKFYCKDRNASFRETQKGECSLHCVPSDLRIFRGPQKHISIMSYKPWFLESPVPGAVEAECGVLCVFSGLWGPCVILCSLTYPGRPRRRPTCPAHLAALRWLGMPTPLSPISGHV